MQVFIHRDRSVVGNCKSNEHKVSRTSESIFEILRCIRRSPVSSGSPGGSSYENLELELVKPFNPSRREIRVPEYRRGIKDPTTTQWRRGPMCYTAMLVKQFSSTRLNFGQGVWKGDSYRQSTLIPTCDAPDLTVH